MPEIPSLIEMLKAGVHFGHQSSRWYPKMEPYIFTERNGVHIINLEKTTEKLKEALDFVKTTIQKGGVVLFLGTKKQAQGIVKKYAEECGAPYIVHRWLGGTLTNFSMISKLLKKYNDLRKKQESGELEKYTKKEQLEFSREIEKLDEIVGGIKDLKSLPDAIFIVDIKKEDTAVAEARKKNIPLIAVCDTNVNPKLVDYVIPGNDDAVKSIEMLTHLVSEAVKEGKKLAKPAEAEKTDKKKEEKDVKNKKKLLKNNLIKNKN